MLFNSFIYILLFLPVVALGYAALLKYCGRIWAQALLLAASLFFYYWATTRAYVELLAGSILFNWLIARVMSSQQGWRRKLLLSRVSSPISRCSAASNISTCFLPR